MDENENQTPLGALLESVNIAEKLTEDELLAIGEDCREGFDTDCTSRTEWEEMLDEWTKLAKQTIEPRTWPWPRASNIKYPLLSTAAMQFNARAYPSLIPATGDVVKVDVIGSDPDGQKTESAYRVSIHMSQQVLFEMEDWEEEMDKLHLALPIVGTMFKKTFFDVSVQRNRSCVVFPKGLGVNIVTGKQIGRAHV